MVLTSKWVVVGVFALVEAVLAAISLLLFSGYCYGGEDVLMWLQVGLLFSSILGLVIVALWGGGESE